MRNGLAILAVTVLCTGCLTMHGSYRLRAVDDKGVELAPNITLMAEGSGIYSARGALCASYPGATVLVEDAKTGQPLKSESPFRCRTRK
ncbi:hypothetical protein SAMN06296058_1571 [Pseudoxanthomonas indica]|uniref:Uncharacterized protein n=1 Tax=Pseudoxanthomonas indica TaxID=428993 RepID=A0A1T5KC57_9GAMM|nr:hypothetical protein SAMN06296058_1571 [Pseudoxanthomonas indica]